MFRLPNTIFRELHFLFISHEPRAPKSRNALIKSCYLLDAFVGCFVTVLGHADGGAVVEALRYNRKVAGSIRDGVIGIFHLHNPSCRIMALGSIHPLTEMSNRNISWG
jgi:hypothetical protein